MCKSGYSQGGLGTAVCCSSRRTGGPVQVYVQLSVAAAGALLYAGCPVNVCVHLGVASSYRTVCPV